MDAFWEGGGGFRPGAPLTPPPPPPQHIENLPTKAKSQSIWSRSCKLTRKSHSALPSCHRFKERQQTDACSLAPNQVNHVNAAGADTGQWFCHKTWGTWVSDASLANVSSRMEAAIQASPHLASQFYEEL